MQNDRDDIIVYVICFDNARVEHLRKTGRKKRSDGRKQCVSLNSASLVVIEVK